MSYAYEQLPKMTLFKIYNIKKLLLKAIKRIKLMIWYNKAAAVFAFYIKENKDRGISSIKIVWIRNKFLILI